MPHNPDHADRIGARLPNELLLGIWDLLPPLERVCVSQVCQKWRQIAHSSPRLWSCVAFVSTLHKERRCRCDRHPASAARSIYQPRDRSDNFSFAATIILRSQQHPLDLTIDVCGSRFYDSSLETLYAVLRPQGRRIVRVHFAWGGFLAFDGFISRFPDSLPALRTVTVGSDLGHVEYSHLPARIVPGARLPSLRQIHIGSFASADFIDWRHCPMPGVHELTLTPSMKRAVLDALASCTNLFRLTIRMQAFKRFDLLYVTRELGGCVDELSHLPELCFTGIHYGFDKVILTHFDDARFRSLRLDYRGSEQWIGSPWYHSLPSPCDALSEPVRLTLKLRDGMYEIIVVDPKGLRREISFDRDTIHMAPRLWDGYLREKTVASATVDAVAWDYFADDLSDPCAIPELELVVLQQPSELEAISLAQFTSLHQLRINVVKRGMKFDGATVKKLVQSRVNEEPLQTLSLSRSATYGDDMSKAAAVLEYL